MFRFLSLLSYTRFHSKTIITVPRILQLSGGLMATGKDTQCYGMFSLRKQTANPIFPGSYPIRAVLPTLGPMVEDLFLSKERLSDDFKELETQKEVLICMLLRLLQYHKVKTNEPNKLDSLLKCCLLLFINSPLGLSIAQCHFESVQI